MTAANPNPGEGTTPGAASTPEGDYQYASTHTPNRQPFPEASCIFHIVFVDTLPAVAGIELHHRG